MCTITLATGDCIQTKTGTKACEAENWTIHFSSQDTGLGLYSVRPALSTEYSTFHVGKFEVGSTQLVYGNFSSDCCTPRVAIAVSDLLGNVAYCKVEYIQATMTSTIVSTLNAFTTNEDATSESTITISQTTAGNPTTNTIVQTTDSDEITTIAQPTKSDSTTVVGQTTPNDPTITTNESTKRDPTTPDHTTKRIPNTSTVQTALTATTYEYNGTTSFPINASIPTTHMENEPYEKGWPILLIYIMVGVVLVLITIMVSGIVWTMCHLSKKQTYKVPQSSSGQKNLDSNVTWTHL